VVSRWPRSTPLGRAAGLLGLGLLFAGFNTGNNLFYLVFAVLAAAELVGFLHAGRVLRRGTARLVLPHRGQVGRPLPLLLELSNARGRTPIPALRWRIATGSEVTELITPAAAPGATVVARGRLVPSARGPLAVERVDATTDYPLGFARRVVRCAPPRGEALIAPRPLPGEAGRIGARAVPAAGRSRTRVPGEQPGEARAYRPGDDARLIDWKATARSPEVIWRERHGDPAVWHEVRLDRCGAPGAAFERRVGMAAGAVLSLLAERGAVRFRSDEIVLDATRESGRQPILDYLALVRPRGRDR